MPESSWPKNDLDSGLNNEIPDPDEQEPNGPELESALLENSQNSKSLPKAAKEEYIYDGRRGKAAAILTIVWGGTIALHLVSWGLWLVLAFTGLLSVQALRISFARVREEPESLLEENRENWPYVSLLVAAKNEEAVIGNLIEDICNLDYPKTRYELWVIDDNSTDNTPEVLAELAREYQQVKVFTRGSNATGGKSGALNQVWPVTKGEILAVFDADARISPDLLQKVLPRFKRPEVGAVQVRKAIANSTFNFWTKGQSTEMAFDSFLQEQRIAIGGIGELRGNGQFVRRAALESCGGWNEQTITDDLDLTIRLHLHQWDIDFLRLPPVEEEGVTDFVALWNQRSRWAEGGYQRYLDYWKPILRNQMGFGKTWDLFGFFVTQYLLPTAAVPDCLMAIALRRLPVTTPLTFLSISLSLLGMFVGLRRARKSEQPSPSEDIYSPKLSSQFAPFSFFGTVLESVLGTVYMYHWLLVMASTTVRISIRPKRLKWVKTVHQGEKKINN
ncbi:MAG: glycosyltransferase family 2 protein [Cyanobacteriota bacterium]|nr:glycosyltransferase family 2 protein [Cyanobacteriota bacterium]